MFQVGTVTDFLLNGKLRNSIKKIKKIKMKFQLKILEKNAEILQKNGLTYISKNFKDLVYLVILKIIIQQ